MEFADRNYKNEILKGNYGVTGNFFQKTKTVTSSYAYTPGDGLLLVDSTAAEVVITLPPMQDWPLKDFRMVIPIIHVAGDNNVKIQLSGSETFNLGNTFFNLGTQFRNFEIFVINSDTVSMYGLLSGIILHSDSQRTSTWASTNFSSATIIPADRIGDQGNTQNELLKQQVHATGSITAVADNSTEIADTILIESAAHGLSVDEIFTVSGTTSYNATYTVLGVPDADNVVVSATFVATETGAWARQPRLTAGIKGDFDISFMFAIDSTGGTAWSAKASVYKNGSKIAITEVEVSGAAGENKEGAFLPYTVALEEDDYIDLRIEQSGLTGNLVESVLIFELRL